MIRLRNPERFWSKVDKRIPDECWPWMGHKSVDGYGFIYSGVGLKSTPILSHRVAFFLSNGPIPVGMCICHKCDNPCCVNPKHLYLGSFSDNSIDTVKRGQHPSLKITEQQALEIYYSLSSCAELSGKYGITHQAVRAIKKGINWRYLHGDRKNIENSLEKKICKYCMKEMPRIKKLSATQWNERIYCSRECRFSKQ